MEMTNDNLTSGRAVKLTALAMIVVVLTQIAYMTVKGAVITGPMIWGTEAIAFLAIAVLALMMLADNSARGTANNGGAPLASPLAWISLSLFGLFNTVQVGMGLTMFGPVGDAGEALAPVMDAIVGGAFFFYFAGKVMVGVAAIAFGLALLKAGGGAAKVIGGLAALAGLAAVLTNIAGMLMGRDVVTIAGAAGTAATLFAAIAVLMLAPKTAS